MNNTDPSSAAPTPQFSEGQKLAGCYNLKKRFAASGDTQVWLAHDEVLGKDVSLHFVPGVLLGDSAALEELRREVKRNRQLIHPQILRVYDLVEEAGWAAISMDAFTGESLAARLEKTPGTGLNPADLQSWLPQLFSTLDDAHKINVLHRDLAPGNIFLVGEGKMLLANFGLSRCLADAVARVSGAPDPRLGARSPQQLDGKAASRADDIYGLGALLYEALAGRPPFASGNAAGEVRTATPVALGEARGPAAAALPASWGKTISASLGKNPEARPASALEMARQLFAESVEIPVKAQPVKAAVVPVATESATGSVVAPQTSSPATFAPKKALLATPASSSPERARSPLFGFVVAAGLVIIGVIGYKLNDAPKETALSETVAGLTTTAVPEGQELRSVNNRLDTPAPLPKGEPVNIGTPEVAKPEPVVVVNPSPKKPDEPVLLAAAATPPPAPAAAKPVTPPAPPAVALPPAELTEEDKALAAKSAALEKVKQIAQAAEKAREDMGRQQKLAEAATAEAQKALDQKAKALAPVKKAADEVLTQRKKLEEEQKSADAAAEQARQLAAEKARVAEVAKKAIADLEAKNKEKISAQEKADTELQALAKVLADKQQAAAGVAKAAGEVDAERARQMAAIKQSEEEVEQARTVAVEARRLREEAEAERRKLGQELSEMQKMMEKKKAEIEERLKKLENPSGKPAVAPPAPVPPAPAPVPAPAPATPVPAVKPTAAATPVPVLSPGATPAPVAMLPKPSTPPPVILETPPVPAATPIPQLAMKTEPEKVPTVLPAAPAPPEPAPAPGENSLGMKFAPVGEVDFCVWQTRVKDFETFAKAVNLKSSAWRGPGFKQGPDHPVVNVTWVEAVAFCKWLSDLEHREGSLPAGQFYRLPTDLEWSKAVGLPEESGKTPEARDMGIADVFPWGTQWPPPPNSGNYTGEETGSDVAIKGYDDGFAWTSPVGSFPPNKLGLYDMGGNVWQWCMDSWNNDSKAKVLRGASWYNGALKLSLLSSCRVHASADSSTDNYGFRVVRAAEPNRPGRR